MTILNPITLSVTYTTTRPSTTIPWYIETLTPGTPDARISANMVSLMNSVPGIDSYTESRPAGSSQMTISLNFNQETANEQQPFTEEQMALFAPPAVPNLANIMVYAKLSLNSTDFNNYLSNIYAYGTQHSCSTSWGAEPLKIS